MNRKTFKWVGWAEGLSYILLLFIGVPLKYLAGNDLLVKALGMPHGLLFILYVGMALWLSIQEKWPRPMLLKAWIASLIPMGPLWFDKKYLS